MVDDYVMVLTTTPADAEVGRRIAETVVSERLAACVNILPAMTSIYRWEGRVQTETEHQLLMKTARSQVERLRERLRELHPYELPEFIVIPIVDGAEGYLTWIGRSVGGDG